MGTTDLQLQSGTHVGKPGIVRASLIIYGH
jgi:hypothetical protein